MCFNPGVHVHVVIECTWPTQVDKEVSAIASSCGLVHKAVMLPSAIPLKQVLELTDFQSDISEFQDEALCSGTLLMIVVGYVAAVDLSCFLDGAPQECIDAHAVDDYTVL